MTADLDAIRESLAQQLLKVTAERDSAQNLLRQYELVITQEDKEIVRDVQRIEAERDALREFANRYLEQFAGYTITNSISAKTDVTGWLRNLARAAVAKSQEPK